MEQVAHTIPHFTTGLLYPESNPPTELHFPQILPPAFFKYFKGTFSEFPPNYPPSCIIKRKHGTRPAREHKWGRKAWGEVGVRVPARSQDPPVPAEKGTIHPHKRGNCWQTRQMTGTEMVLLAWETSLSSSAQNLRARGAALRASAVTGQARCRPRCGARLRWVCRARGAWHHQYYPLVSPRT